MSKLLFSIFIVAAITLQSLAIKAQNISTFAGYNSGGYGGFGGDGGPATLAKLFTPLHVRPDKNDNIYIADYDNNRIRKVDTNGIISTIAGNITSMHSGDGGPATLAGIIGTKSVAIDNSGNIYIAEHNYYSMTPGQLVRKVDTNGIISAFAGGDSIVRNGVAATATDLGDIYDIVTDNVGNLYITDDIHRIIRKVDTNGIITTVAGNGAIFYSGDGVAATAAGMQPGNLATDNAGNLYICDITNCAIRKVDKYGFITTIAGNGIRGFYGDNGPGKLAELDDPEGIVLDSHGNLYVADMHNYRIRRIDSSGIITTIAGTGIRGFSGDGGPATLAQFTDVFGVCTDSKGNIYLADGHDYNIRKISKSITTGIDGENILPSQNIELYQDVTGKHISLNIHSTEILSKVIIYNSCGQKMLEKTVRNNIVNNMELSCSSGIYFVKLITNSNIFSREIRIN